jgi:hypothetical protein
MLFLKSAGSWQAKNQWVQQALPESLASSSEKQIWVNFGLRQYQPYGAVAPIPAIHKQKSYFTFTNSH